jgi:hypothetical protein
MTRLKLQWSALLIRVGVATAIMPVVPLWAGPPLAQSVRLAPSVRLTPIGHPTWKPVDFHVFTAPVGTAATEYAEFSATTLALLPPPNHESHPDLGVGPSTPHSPPDDAELANGVADLGFHEGSSSIQRNFPMARVCGWCG